MTYAIGTLPFHALPEADTEDTLDQRALTIEP